MRKPAQSLTMFRRGCSALIVLSLVAASVASCRSGRDSPEARVRAAIERAETSAEAKDLGSLKGLISDAYRDDGGQEKHSIMALLFLQLRRHDAIHLLTRIAQITLQPPAQATATVFAAMAGRPIAAVSDLPGLHADLYRFDLTLADEQGTWRVTKAAWRPATLDDFLPPRADH